MLTWYLVLGRERDFALLHNFKLYMASWHRQTYIWYKFWQHLKAFIIFIILYQFQKDPFCLIVFIYDILFYFIHVWSLRARGDNPCGHSFRCKQKSPIILITGCIYQKNIFALWFYAHFFFMILYMYIAQKGQTTNWGLNFDSASSIWSFVASIKKISSTSDFIHIFSWFNKGI